MTNRPPDPETAAERTPGAARGELAPDDGVIDALDRSALAAASAAGEEALACMSLLESRDSNVVAELFHGHDTIYEWTHYPEADVYDRENHSQFYYHVHPGALAGGEHGHFHLFLRASGMPGEIRCEAPLGSLCHIVAVSMSWQGEPLRLFTTNRWVTDDRFFEAGAVKAMLEHVVIDRHGPYPTTSRWLGAMVRLFAPDIRRLIDERDRVIEEWALCHPDGDVHEDRALEIPSHMAIDVPGRVAALRARLG